MLKKLLTLMAMFAAGGSGAGIVAHHQSAEARERRALAALCDDGAAFYLRCAGADCRVGVPGSGVLAVEAGRRYQYAQPGIEFAWLLTRTSTTTTTSAGGKAP